jgi:Holliday junction resolvasome RuvABC ATP-dependent DNA helicase subunit
MRFIGQEVIMNQLQAILPELYSTHGSENFLLRGPSGWGKTKLALQMCNYLTAGKFKMYLGNDFNERRFNSEVWVHFLDEVHLLEPVEPLYPLLDAKTHVFILATNDRTVLAEPLVNRCLDLTFTDYSILELRVILRESGKIRLPDSYLNYIIETGAKNPRICIRLLRKIEMILKLGGDISTLDKFKEFLQNSLGIQDGFDTLAQRYLQILREIGGVASIDTISQILHVDKETLRSQIEPILLYRNRVRISSRGRTLVYE